MYINRIIQVKGVKVKVITFGKVKVKVKVIGHKYEIEWPVAIGHPRYIYCIMIHEQKASQS